MYLWLCINQPTAQPVNAQSFDSICHAIIVIIYNLSFEFFLHKKQKRKDKSRKAHKTNNKSINKRIRQCSITRTRSHKMLTNRLRFFFNLSLFGMRTMISLFVISSSSPFCCYFLPCNHTLTWWFSYLLFLCLFDGVTFSV